MQAGSAASLEWSVAWLTNGRPRGCLKPILECAVGHVGTLAAAVGVTRKTVDWIGGIGLEWGSTMGLLGWAVTLVVWMDSVVRWSPKSSLMG